MRKHLYILAFFFLFSPSLLYPQSVYDLVRGGTEESLRAACRERSLEVEGSLEELKRRLLEYEFKQNTVPFLIREKNATAGDIVLYNADFAEYMKDESGNDLILLSGSVDLTYSGRKITADRISVNIDREIITGSGNITFVDSGKVYHAESFHYDGISDEGIFINAQATIGRFTYRGPIIKKLAESGKLVAEDVSITTCELQHPHYRIDADELYIYDGERVLIKNASFYYGSDPVFILPFFYRNLKEPAIKSALYFRQRSGTVVQNTYYPMKGEEKSLKLMGDFYERLGFYLGSEYFAQKEQGSSTHMGVSAALSNDVYIYDGVNETWSPLGPPLAGEYGIQRYVRYRIGLYQKFRFGEKVKNQTELNFFWVSDPYYQYDFERRKEQFDPFDVIGQAGYDYPQKGSGFTWFLNNYLTYNTLSFSVKNSVRFEPQRNVEKFPFTSPDYYVSLPDYYENRIYSLIAPDVTLTHTQTLLSQARSAVFSDLDYRSSVGYSHSLYYDSTGSPSSEVQQGNTEIGVKKEYAVAPFVRFTPDIAVGGQVQQHVDPSSSQSTDDRQNTLLYTRTKADLTLGSSDLYLALFHDLKYKLYGPEDDFQYGSFRVHDFGIRGYAGSNIFTEQFTTSVDLRPDYDWTSGRYEPLTLERERFFPFINTLTFTPFSTLSMTDRLVYEIARSQFKLNNFLLKYQSNALNLGERPLMLGWELSWKHYFVNPVLDTLRSTFGVSAQVHPYWLLYLSVTSRNDDIWKYYNSGDEKVNPFVDLLKSFNFFNTNDRKESNFKMKSISLGFVHDLHDWEMKFDYTGSRELSYDGSRYVWNNTYSISIGLKEVKSLNIHTEFNELRE
jgi:hypothetical protein